MEVYELACMDVRVCIFHTCMHECIEKHKKICYVSRDEGGLTGGDDEGED
jgi:hypothetical protein